MSFKQENFNPVTVAVKWALGVALVILMFPTIFCFVYEVEDIKALIASQHVEEAVSTKSNIDAESGLIIGPGYKTVRGTCGACHSLELVTQNRATRDGWKDIIVWMQETQKLWDLGESEEIILDYLEKNYAPEEQGRRAPLKDIDWYEL